MIHPACETIIAPSALMIQMINARKAMPYTRRYVTHRFGFGQMRASALPAAKPKHRQVKNMPNTSYAGGKEKIESNRKSKASSSAEAVNDSPRKFASACGKVSTLIEYPPVENPLLRWPVRLCGLCTVFAVLLLTSPHAGAASGQGLTLTLPILTYHYLEPVQDKKDRLRIKLSVNPDVFEEQLQALREKKYRTVFVREIPAILNGSGAVSMKRIALTFDDGYEDFYINAFPLLKKYNMEATVYIVNDFIGLPGYLTDGEITVLLASGLVEVGCHTLHHLDLAKISPDQARTEIADAKRLYEKKFATRMDTFAYPFGQFTRNIIALVKQAKFTAAVTTQKGFLQSGKNIFTLKRIPAGSFTGKRKWKAIGDTR